MNLFERAIKKNELLDFAQGLDEYYVLDRQYDEHSVLLSYKQNILPFLSNKKASEGIQKMFLELVQSDDIEKQAKNELLVYHLHVYYYLRKTGEITDSDSLLNINKTLFDYLHNLEKAIISSVENGGLIGYYPEIIAPVIYSIPFDFDLLKIDTEYTFNVHFYQPNEHIRSFRLLASEVPEKYKQLAPLAADMRLDTMSYRDREILPAIVLSEYNSEEE